MFLPGEFKVKKNTVGGSKWEMFTSFLRYPFGSTQDTSHNFLIYHLGYLAMQNLCRLSISGCVLNPEAACRGGISKFNI